MNHLQKNWLLGIMLCWYRKYFVFVVASCVIVLIASCNEDDPAISDRKLALTLITDGLSATSEVFVTDPDGNVLESTKNNGQLAFFATRTAPYYQLTIIDLIGNSYYIKTYQQVPSSSYFIKSTTSSGNVAGVHRISFPNVAGYPDFRMQSEHLYNILTVSDTEFDLQLIKNPSDLFLTLKKDASGTPSYMIRQGAEAGKTTFIDEVALNQFKPMLSKEVTSIASTTESYRYQIYGNIGNSKQLLVSSYEPPEIIFTPAPVYLYYPEPTYLFTNYTTQVSYNTLKGNYIASILHINTDPVPAEPAEQPDARLISYQEGAGNYQFTMTGKADCTHTLLQAFQGDKSINWEVYAPFSEQNTIQVPAFLISYLNEKQFSFSSDLKFRFIESIDDSFVLSYTDFLQLELKKDGTVKFVKSRLTINYPLPQ